MQFKFSTMDEGDYVVGVLGLDCDWVGMGVVSRAPQNSQNLRINQRIKF